MCKTCGCGGGADITVTSLQDGERPHMQRSAPSGHACSHEHPHPHEHDDDQHHHHQHDGHDHDHPHVHPHLDGGAEAGAAAGAEPRSVTVELERAVLDKNDRLATRNRAWFEGREVLVLNLVSSPGAGKTSLLERTIREFKSEILISVIEGDQQTVNDAERIKAAGAPAVQINTGTGCHLDADMIQRALETLKPPFGSLVMIENVGNLVCPAAREVNPNIRSIRLSSQSGEGMDAWYAWLRAAWKRHRLGAPETAPARRSVTPQMR